MEEKDKADFQRRRKYQNFRIIREEKLSKIREKYVREEVNKCYVRASDRGVSTTD